MEIYARQGDVGIFRLTEAEVPEKLKAVKRDARGRVVLAEGEVTGHFHAIADQGVELYEVMGEVDRILRVTNTAGAAVVHDEHATIDLPKGNYRVVIQSEYSPEAIRRVVD